MDDWTTEKYMREMLHQADFAVLAHDDLAASVHPDIRDVRRSFAAAQLLLASAAMISKMLWPAPPDLNKDGTPLSEADELLRAKTLARGKHLRKTLGIKQVPVLESRKVRNGIEHFDDRMDRFFEERPSLVIDRNVGPKGKIVKGIESVTYLRHIDPTRGRISVLQDEVSVEELMTAIENVAARAHQWCDDHSHPQRDPP